MISGSGPRQWVPSGASAGDGAELAVASTASGLREGMPVRSIDGVSVLGWEIRDVVSHLSARTKPVQGDAEPLVVEFGLPRPERQTRRAARLKREAKAGRRKAVLATARLEREAAASAARAPSRGSASPSAPKVGGCTCWTRSLHGGRRSTRRRAPRRSPCSGNDSQSRRVLRYVVHGS